MSWNNKEKSMKVVTVEEFLAFGPCYSRARIRKIAGNKKEWTALDVLNLEDVPAEDRLWAVLRDEFIDAKTLRLFAVWCARQCKQTDPVCIEAINVAERYANGKGTTEALVAAGIAARGATLSTAGTAAYDATLYDAQCAARYSACAIAECAARSVLGDAMYIACTAQVAHLVDMLEKDEEE